MRLLALVLAGSLAAAPAVAQEPQASPNAAQASPAPDISAADHARLERIREALKRSGDTGLLASLDRTADFRVEIQEKAKLDEILKKLDFKSGPAPAGGLYGYEQQRRLFNPVDRPLMQPYAAFNGGQLITIAIENLLGSYLIPRAIESAKTRIRTREQQAAYEEALRDIEAFCASRPDRGTIVLCNPDRP
jgi:hypothetical protein